MTGNLWGNIQEIREDQIAIDFIHQTYIERPDSHEKKTPALLPGVQGPFPLNFYLTNPVSSSLTSLRQRFLPHHTNPACDKPRKPPHQEPTAGTG